MRIAYADPPYPGYSHLYKHHEDYGGEVDHVELLRKLDSYDGWVLHTASVSLTEVIDCVAAAGISHSDYRIFAWVKPFAAFKANVPVAYAWEPVLVKACRRPTVENSHQTMRDWFAENITLQRGLVGVKPERVCWWLFDCLGATPDDDLDDLFIGSGAVTEAWNRWRNRQHPEPLELELA